MEKCHTLIGDNFSVKFGLENFGRIMSRIETAKPKPTPPATSRLMRETARRVPNASQHFGYRILKLALKITCVSFTCHSMKRMVNLNRML